MKEDDTDEHVTSIIGAGIAASILNIPLDQFFRRPVGGILPVQYTMISIEYLCIGACFLMREVMIELGALFCAYHQSL